MANTTGYTHGPARPSRLRAVVAAILIGLAIVIAPLGIVGNWVVNDLKDTDRFVAALAPLASDPEVQDVVVAALVQEVDRQVDLEALVDSAFVALGDLGLSDRAQSALGLLAGPSVAALREELERAANWLVTSDSFANIWARTLNTTHSQLINALEGEDPGVLVIGDAGDIGISLGPLMEPLRERLATTGSGQLARLIPPIDVIVPVTNSEQIAGLATWYPIVVTAGTWTQWVALSLLLVGIVVANRRLRALGIAALILAAVMGAVYLAIGWGENAFANALTQTSVLTEAAADSIYDALAHPMISMTQTVGLIALAVGLAALIILVIVPKPVGTPTY